MIDCPGGTKELPGVMGLFSCVLDGGGDYAGVYIYQDPLNCQLKICASYCRQI